MALGHALTRMGASSLLVLRQRLELAALDVEEELLRRSCWLLGAIATMLLATLALAGLSAALVAYFWDGSRIAALVALGVFYGAAACGAAWRLARALREKPAFLGATVQELATDGERLGQRP